jgi:GntR family transcriptional regulator, transcriptional repressor for pyruvate dehydrogenase complex
MPEAPTEPHEPGLDRLSPVDKPDLHGDVTQQLAALAAALPPGARLPTERDLGERLGVGRSTLREALKPLQFIGAVRAVQGAGLTVGPADPDAVARMLGLGLMFQRPTVREVIAARRLLEVEIAGLAALHASPTDLTTLRQAVEAARTYAAERPRVAKADVAFHVALARASGNTVLRYLVGGMRALVEVWMANAIRDRDVVDGLVAEHQAILEAIAAGDAAAARAAMDHHLERAALRLTTVIDLDAPLERFAADLLPGLTP